MKKALLVLNAGSSSLRFVIFHAGEWTTVGACICRGRIEGIGHRGRFVVQGADNSSDVTPLDAAVILGTHADALQSLLDWIRVQASGLQFVAAGHRVVHGGVHFSMPMRIDAGVLARLEQLIPLAPLHQAHPRAAIEALGRIDPGLTQVACFDTAFHRTVPAVAQTFALPRALTAEDIRPYGFHGLSYEHIAGVLPEYLPAAAEGRVIVAHLGHGASMCAMIGRRSVATTMTFTPLDGLPMAARCGSLDPGVLLYLMGARGMAADAVADLLYGQSGMLGVSSVSGDMRELLASSDPQAAEAVDLFVYLATLELGSLAAAMGGLDALVFTGGIGEHAAVIREQICERICERTGWLGVRIDSAANDAGGPQVSAADSPVSVWVIPANEELGSMINQHAKWLTICEELPWRAPIASINLLVTSTVWRQEHNGFTHQDPGFLDVVVNKSPQVSRVYLPPDVNCLLATADHCLRSHNDINVIVCDKQRHLQYLDMDAALRHCAKGLGIWDWASNGQDGEPDVVMVGCGDIPTQEALAATALLRDHFPDLAIRFINVVDLFRMTTPNEHPQGLPDRDFDGLFTEDKPIIFDFHGYPWLIHRLAYRRTNHRNLHVRGYKERGSINTPLELAIENEIDRFSLAIDVIKRVPRLQVAGAHVKEKLRNRQIDCRRYAHLHGVDLPQEIDWAWPH